MDLNSKELDALRFEAKRALWSRGDDQAAYASLIDRGLPVDDRLGYNSPPILWAAKEGRFDWVEFFLDRGADPGSVLRGLASNFGAKEQDPEFVARRLALFRRAAEGLSEEELAVAPHSPLASALRYGVDWLIDELLTPERAASLHKGEEGFLQSCAHFGKNALARRLVEAGADPNAKGYMGNGPLHEYALRGDLEMARLFLERGADPNARNDADETPLWIAATGVHAKSGRLELVEALLDAGSDPNTRRNGMLLLSKAARIQAPELASLLIARGASLDERNGKKLRGKSSAQVAEQVGGAAGAEIQDAALLQETLPAAPSKRLRAGL